MGGILELVEQLRTCQGIVFIIAVAGIIYFGWKWMMGKPRGGEQAEAVKRSSILRRNFSATATRCGRVA